MHSMAMRGVCRGVRMGHAPLLGLTHPHGAHALMRPCALSVMRLVHWLAEAKPRPSL